MTKTKSEMEELKEAFDLIGTQLAFAMKSKERHLCKAARKKFAEAEVELVNLYRVYIDRLKKVM
jgi:hypothetical protein